MNRQIHQSKFRNAHTSPTKTMKALADYRPISGDKVDNNARNPEYFRLL